MSKTTAVQDRTTKKQNALRAKKYRESKRDDPVFKSREAARKRDLRRRQKVRLSLDQDARRNLELQINEKKRQIDKKNEEIAEQKVEIELLKKDLQKKNFFEQLEENNDDDDIEDFDDYDPYENDDDWNTLRVDQAMLWAEKGKTIAKRRTGFSWTHYKSLEKFVTPFFETTTLTGTQAKRARSRDEKLTVAQQVFLTLNYLKNYPTFGSLAFEFGIPQKQVFYIF